MRLSRFAVTVGGVRRDYGVQPGGQPIVIPRDASVEIYGAAYMSGYVSYHLIYRPVDDQGLPRQFEWARTGAGQLAPAGSNSQDVRLLIWTPTDRQSLPPGRYELFLRMYTASGQYTVNERDYEVCWAFVQLE
jgi:hypothetical protein